MHARIGDSSFKSNFLQGFYKMFPILPQCLNKAINSLLQVYALIPSQSRTFRCLHINIFIKIAMKKGYFDIHNFCIIIDKKHCNDQNSPADIIDCRGTVVLEINSRNLTVSTCNKPHTKTPERLMSNTHLCLKSRLSFGTSDRLMFLQTPRASMLRNSLQIVHKIWQQGG